VVWLRPEWFGIAATGETGSFAQAVERAAPAVVNIHTDRRVARGPMLEDPLLDRYFGDQAPPSERIESSLGSGVLISDQGYVLTNNHVIAGADAIHVALLDGRVAPARVVGSDPETDLALLHIELRPLPSVPLGRTDALRVGDVVLAIGNPFGFGQTVTQGIVSATGRNYLGLATFENFIQTDAAINPGNSGGALINADGELVGINTAYYAQTGGSQGIGFAIPTDLARGVMDHLILHGRVIRGWLGVTPQDLTPELVDALQLPAGHGVLVSAVQQGGPAGIAGLRPWDIIVEIDGQPVINSRHALNRIASMTPGSVADLSVWRDGTMIERQVTIGERGGS
jgi:serine protease DegS